MIKQINIIALLLLFIFSNVAVASYMDHSQPAVKNNSHYLLEFSQMSTAMVSENPVPFNSKATLEPIASKHIIRGHIMVVDPKKSGRYQDNLIFYYTKVNNKWHFLKVISLYNGVKVNINKQGDLVITKK